LKIILFQTLPISNPEAKLPRLSYNAILIAKPVADKIATKQVRSAPMIVAIANSTASLITIDEIKYLSS